MLVQCHLFDRSTLVAIFIFSSAWKRKLGRGRCDITSCQVSLNSVQRFQRRSRKCLSQSEVGMAILFFDPPGKHNLGRGRWDLASCQVSLNSVQQFQRKSRKCISQSEAREASCVPEKHKLSRGRWDLASCQLSFVEFRSAVSEEKSKMSRPIRCWDLASCQVSSNSLQQF